MSTFGSSLVGQIAARRRRPRQEEAQPIARTREPSPEELAALRLQSQIERREAGLEIQRTPMRDRTPEQIQRRRQAEVRGELVRLAGLPEQSEFPRVAQERVGARDILGQQAIARDREIEVAEQMRRAEVARAMEQQSVASRGQTEAEIGTRTAIELERPTIDTALSGFGRQRAEDTLASRQAEAGIDLIQPEMEGRIGELQAQSREREVQAALQQRQLQIINDPQLSDAEKSAMLAQTEAEVAENVRRRRVAEISGEDENIRRDLGPSTAQEEIDRAAAGATRDFVQTPEGQEAIRGQVRSQIGTGSKAAKAKIALAQTVGFDQSGLESLEQGKRSLLATNPNREDARTIEALQRFVSEDLSELEALASVDPGAAAMIARMWRTNIPKPGPGILLGKERNSLIRDIEGRIAAIATLE